MSDELLKVANEILLDFQSKPEGRNSRGSDIQRAEIATNYQLDINPVAQAAIRYFGDWIVPEDEEDEDGDYDWEVPTHKTTELIKTILINHREKYKEFDIKFSVDEKNWITIYVVNKRYSESIVR